MPTFCKLLAIVLLAGAGVNSKVVNAEDKLGPSVIQVVDKDRERKLGQMRSFIWTHWRQHLPARLLETTYSKEGRPAETTMMILPGERGTWRLKVKTIWRSAKEDAQAHDSAEYTVFTIRRIQRNHNGSNESVIPENASLPGEAYRLVFYDENGKEAGGL